jgi:FtsH-binding integral membrane protein
MFSTILKKTFIRGLRTKVDKVKYLPLTTTKLFLPISTIDNKKQIHNSKYLNKFNKKETLLDQVDKNIGLRNYLVNIYKKSGYGFATTLGVGIITPLVAGSLGLGLIAPIIWIANIPFGFYSIYKLTKLQSTTEIKDGMLIEKENQEKIKWFNIFSISNGITIGPVIMFSMAIGPSVVPIALACTGGVFAASTLYALKKTNLSLIKYHGPLIGCVGGLICSGLVQIGMCAFGFGNSANILGLGLATSVISSGIFSALIAVDTHLAIKSYDEHNLDSTGIAINILLDVTNLFLDLLRIIGEISKAFNSNA